MRSPINSHDPHSTPAPSPPATLPHVELEIVRGNARRRVRPVRGAAFFLGTNQDCELVLNDPSFPPFYACLIVDGSGVLIRHLGSGPPLSIDGVRATKSRLRDRTCIEAGPFEFALHLRRDEPGEQRELRLFAEDESTLLAARRMNLSVGLASSFSPPEWHHISELILSGEARKRKMVARKRA